jgi:hypothetical protein
MTLTAKQKAWDKFKSVQRAERQPVGADPGMRTVSGRAKQRAARRPNRRQSGRTAVHVDRGVFNINTGRHEPLPRVRHDVEAIGS